MQFKTFTKTHKTNIKLKNNTNQNVKWINPKKKGICAIEGTALGRVIEHRRAVCVCVHFRSFCLRSTKRHIDTHTDTCDPLARGQ